MVFPKICPRLKVRNNYIRLFAASSAVRKSSSVGLPYFNVVATRLCPKIWRIISPQAVGQAVPKRVGADHDDLSRQRFKLGHTLQARLAGSVFLNQGHGCRSQFRQMVSHGSFWLAIARNTQSMPAPGMLGGVVSSAGQACSSAAGL
jgi:hypothetical protein